MAKIAKNTTSQFEFVNITTRENAAKTVDVYVRCYLGHKDVKLKLLGETIDQNQVFPTNTVWVAKVKANRFTSRTNKIYYRFDKEVLERLSKEAGIPDLVFGPLGFYPKKS